jgi:putative ABC transport system permease protein
MLVLRDAGMITALGIGIGLPGAYALGMVTRSFLFGVSATTPTVFLLAAGVLAAVATLASLVPARRAARVDPVVALRE